jgi:hypothetical protein
VTDGAVIDGAVTDGSARPNGAWLFGPRRDLSLVLGPIAIATVAHFAVPADFGSPLWAYLLFIVSFDVAHVWATGYLTYFDRHTLRARRGLLIAVPIVTFVASFGLHLASNVLFWTAIAYVAIGHFIKQQIGFVMLYKGMARERSPADYRLDKLAIWLGALGPLALWHADPQAAFEWFGADEEFALRVPRWLAHCVVGAMGTTQLVWISRQLWLRAAGRPVSIPKVVWILASWVSWWMGVRVAANFIVATAFINLFHGIPYTALVWWRCSRAPDGRAEFIRRWATRSSIVAFYLLLLSLALVEESLWERFVWHAYLPEMGISLETLGAVATSAWVALLSLPQITHYVLDGVLWRLTPANADLRRLILGR